MKAKKLDARTLRSLSRRFRLAAKGPKRNYDLSPKQPPAQMQEERWRFNEGETRGYWRGWHCALQQLADELLEDARRLEKGTSR